MTSRVFELFPNRVIHLFLFKDVTNCKQLRLLLKDQPDKKISLINARMVPSEFIALLAANKTLHVESLGKLKTKNIYHEVVWNFHSSRNMAEAFNVFGISDTSDLVLACIFDGTEEELGEVPNLVQGIQIPLEELPAMANTDKIMKLHKISERELERKSLVDLVSTRMAARETM